MKSINTNELNENIFWVGIYDNGLEINNNPYLLIDQHEAVLFDPGSLYEFERVFQNVKELVNIRKIKYIVFHNTKPDTSACLSLLEKKGIKANMVVHAGAKDLPRYYRSKFNIIPISEQNNKISLHSGRVLHFIETPYLPHFESIATYDTQTKTLFSGALFGATPRKWKLYADKVFYKESMKSYHERIIPGNEFLRPVMDILLKLELSCIAPHHGSIIKDRIDRHIKILRELDCGIFLNPIKNDLTRKEGFIGLCNKILGYYYLHFNKFEVYEVFNNTEIVIDEKNGRIETHDKPGDELWDNFFNIIYTKKGIRWITIIYEDVQKLVKKYNIAEPAILSKREKEVIKLDLENIKLKELNERLEETKEHLTKDPITKLYNEPFFRDFLESQIAEHLADIEDFCVFLIDIDRISNIKVRYGEKGKEIKNKTIKTVAYILEQYKDNTHQIFKLSDDSFAYFIHQSRNEIGVEIAENIRNDIEKSDLFYEPITVSIGFLTFNELHKNDQNVEDILGILRDRLEGAKEAGMNYVCSISKVIEEEEKKNKILIVDADEMYIEVLIVSFLELDYEVFSCTDGEQAMKLIETQKPDLVISELMVPKFNGLAIRENMLAMSSHKNVPFIMMSFLKNEETTRHSMDLEIDHYLRKPIRISELIIIVDNIFKKLEA